MKLFIILLISPAVLCTQRLRKSTDPNDEPFLPIHPQYPYSPKLMKRGLEHAQGHQQQPQGIPGQLGHELYAPKVDARDSYSGSFGGQGPASFYSPSAYDALTKSSLSSAALTSGSAASAYSPYQSSYPGLNSSPYSSLLGSYGSPYGSAAPSSFGLGTPGLGVSPYAAAAAAGPGAAPGAYPNPYSYYPQPYYYPGYYGQPGPYGPPPPPGYPGAPYKHPHDDEDDDEDDRRPKGRKHHKNKQRNHDRDNQYVDGANYIISSTKDLDSESSTHRTPSHLNQIEDAEVAPRAVVLPKATYRLVSLSGQPDNSGSTGYIKVQQLEQLMRQALAKLLAQNAAQQANLAQIQDAGKEAQQYISVPNTIAKTGLSYVVNPTILNRVTPGQYNPSTLIQTIGSKPYVQKGTSVTLQQSPGIYIPPTKSGNDQPAQDYADYDNGDNVTTRPSITNYQATAEPTRNYPYSTYRPTQQTSLDDVNFGNKQKNKT